MSKYSLVITNYNRQNTLARAIRSCVNQLTIGEESEVIVIDDGSTDDSLKVCREFSDNIILHKFKKNCGISKASNQALKISKSDFWIRVDSDDYISQFACHFMGTILKSNHDIDFVYADHIRVNHEGMVQEKVSLDTEEKLLNHGAGVLFRKSALLEVGGYDESLPNAEDYDLILRLMKNGSKGFYLPIPLYRYYIHGENITLDSKREHFVKLVRGRHGI